MKISTLYRSHDPHLLQKIRDGVREQIRAAMADHEIKVFFRADDIAVPSKNFSRMMDLFLSYRIPLCLAVVPAWLTPKRWEATAEFREKGKDELIVFPSLLKYDDSRKQPFTVSAGLKLPTFRRSCCPTPRRFHIPHPAFA